MTLLGDLGPTVIGVMSLEVFLAFIFVAARLYTRLILKQCPLGWDDHTIVMSLVLLSVYSFMCIAAATLGMGRHSSTLTVPQIAHANKIEIIGQTFCIIGIGASKTSVALFLWRIVIHRWQKAILALISVSVTVICILCATVDFVQCTPVEHVWNPEVPGKCWTSITPWSYAAGGSSVIADFVLAILPWQILYGLQMPMKDKILIGSSLSFGLIAGVCGIVRCVSLSGLNARSDYTYQTVGLILWSSTELTITIVSASIPALRPLWHLLTGKLKLNSRYRSSDNTDEFSDPTKNRAPFLSHHMRNLERRKGGLQQKKQDEFDGTLFSTRNGTVVDATNGDGGEVGEGLDAESGIAILRYGGEMGGHGHERVGSGVLVEVESARSEGDRNGY